MDFNLDYTTIDGEKDSGDITIFALSTCAYCKMAFKFLMGNSIKFRYIYVDLLPSDAKEKLKSDLRDVSGDRYAFPFMFINREKLITGFTEEAWRKVLLGEK